MTKKTPPDTLIEPTPTRKEYNQSDKYQAMAEANAAPIFDREDPIALFSEWMVEARREELNDSNAMALSTVDADGMPDTRMVLLKGVDDRGFVFYTNSRSHKGTQLIANPKAALCFHWKSLRRQVRVRGEVERVIDAEADAYFASRARGSQLGAWSSDQSQPIDSREDLEAKVEETEFSFKGKEITRPPFWYGFRVIPQSIEFWRDRPYRLHDRMLFEKTQAGWATMRLQP